MKIRVKCYTNFALRALQRLNPLGVICTDGDLEIFESTTDCYYHTIIQLWDFAPRGWIDMPLFVSEVQRIPLSVARQACRYKTYAKILWSDKLGKRDVSIEFVLRSLSANTGCEFKPAYFREAIRMFNNFMDDRNDK